MYSSLESRSISLKGTRRSGAAPRGRSKVILGGRLPAPEPGEGPLERPGSAENLGRIGFAVFSWRRGCEGAPVRCRLFVNWWSENAC